MLQRLARNLVRLPRRTAESIAKRLTPAYRIQRRADRFVHRELDEDRLDALCAVPGNTSYRQCRLLFYLATTSLAEGVICEIGAFKGKSTAWLAEAARRSRRTLVSIDPHVDDTWDTFQRTVRQFDIESVAEIHKACSHELGKDWDRPIAFLWVDGDHRYEGVRQDIIDFTPHVAPGGIVVFDDVNEQDFPGVVQALAETIDRDASFTALGCIKTFGLFQRKSD